ncbi:MAG: redoxin family protein [Gracilimonas sp.]|uniref:redoxin family protein n=1 Tax=Gracilimonas sp. TaxID=1974203 RepID=UPI0037521C6C|nr:redoxin family protein [Gracilimonas sp.]
MSGVQMNKKLNGLLIFFLGITATGLAQNITPLGIGTNAPETERVIVDTSGLNTTLSDVADNNGLLVIFSCNTCPWVAKWEDQYNQLSSLAAQNDIGMIALNPNERIRNRGESINDMRRRAQKQGYNFTYALDKDHIIADAFGATRTPEVFLFDGNLQLVYHGAVDDHADSRTDVNIEYLKEALLAIAAGKDIEITETEIHGCTIKRTK